MKSKSLRLFLFAAALTFLTACQNTADYGDIANLRDSQPYHGPTDSFYDPWYGGSGAYVGSGYRYGGAGIGISVPVIP